jgi:hypothetical protein
MCAKSRGTWEFRISFAALVSLVLCAIIFPVLAQEAPVLSLSDYVAFLHSRGTFGPPALGNQAIAETDADVYAVSYSLENVASDVTQVYVVLWRLVDEPGNRHFFGEDSKTLAYSEAQGATISFSGLEMGETYAVHLAATTAMPSIVSGQALPDVTVGTQTVCLLWPLGSTFHLTVQDFFLPFDLAKTVCMELQDASGQPDWAVKAHRFDGVEHEISGPSKEKKRLFCKSEVDSWQPEEIENLAIEAQNGAMESRLSFTLPLAYACLDCNPLAPPNPQSEQTMTSGPLLVGVKNNWGAAISKIRFTFLSDNVQTSNLISGVNPGMLLQGAGWKVKENWVEDKHNPNIGTYSQEDWELDAANYSTCGNPEGFAWNPTQAASDASGSNPCTPVENVLSTNVTAQFRLDSGMLDRTIAREVPLPLSPVLTPPLRTVAKYKPWHPYDKVYEAVDNGSVSTTYWKYQADLWEDSTLSFEATDLLDVGTIRFRSKFRISKKDVSGSPTIWPPLTDLGGTLPRGPNLDYTFQDRYVAGSKKITHGYVYYPPATSRDHWNMAETGTSGAPPRCTISASNSCYGDEGWYTPLHQQGRWAPYLMLSTDDIAGTDPLSKVYMLLCSAQDAQPIMATRSVALATDSSLPSAWDIGDEMWVSTLFDNSGSQRTLTTNAWTPDLTTYVIVGTKPAVMSELGRICKDKLPAYKYPFNTHFVSGTITGLNGNQAKVTIAGPEGEVKVKTVPATGAYAVFGLYDCIAPTGAGASQ